MHIHKRFNELYNSAKQENLFSAAPGLLQRAANNWPNHTALICENYSVTFQTVYHQSLHITKKLIKQGIKPDDRIIIAYENSITFFRAYWGAWQTGALIAPLNVYLKEFELKHIIDDFQPRVLILSQKQKEKIPQKILDAHIILTDNDLDTPDKAPDDYNSYQVPDGSDRKPSIVLYTSGTTGMPKGVMLSSRNIIVSCLQGIATFEISEDDRICASLPLFHSLMQNACIWGPTLIGRTVIIVPKISRSNILEALSHKPTFLVTIPQLYGLFALMRPDLSSVKQFLSGGDNLPDKIRMAFSLIYRRKIGNGYGLTETSPFIAIDTDDMMGPTNIVGATVPEVEVRICDKDGNPIASDQVGVLWIKGENVMLGYLNAPEATEEIIKDGWLKTGDLATITQEKKIMLCGRAKELIIHKGLNIYPQEIENILMTHPDVQMAAVVPKKHDHEEIPVAFIATKESEKIMIPELRDLCKKHLATYKHPREWHIRRNLPTTATGKADKKELKKELN